MNMSHIIIWTKMEIWQGYVDAVAGDLFYLQTYMENYPNRFRILDQSLEKSKLAEAFAKNADPELVSNLNEVLKEMKQDGTVDEILKKYGASSGESLEEAEQ